MDSELFLSLNLAKLPIQYQNYEWTQITQTDSYTVSNIFYYVLAKPNIFIKALNAATSVIDERQTVTQRVVLHQYGVSINLNKAAVSENSNTLKQIASLIANPVVSFNIGLDNSGRVRFFKFKMQTNATQSQNIGSTSTTSKSLNSVLNFGYDFDVGYGIAAFGIPVNVSSPVSSKVLSYSIYQKYLNSKP